MQPRAKVAALLIASVVAGGAASSASAVTDSAGVNSSLRTRASWSDEFRGPAGSAPNRKRWSFDTGATGWGNGELQRYTKTRANSRLDGRGHLVIVARRRSGRDSSRGSFTSARLKTAGHFAFRYGKVAMRAKLPHGRGLWPAFWMLGSGFPRLDWPFCGEIDVMENLGHRPRISYGYVHGPGSLAEEGVGGEHRSNRSLADRFHVFAAEWSRAEISFSVDGLTFETVRRVDYPPGQTWAFDRRMFLLVNLAVGGEWPGRPSRSTRFPARMTVDWIRVWKAA